jgi:hypothetical protein
LQDRDVFTEPFVFGFEPLDLGMLGRSDTVTIASVHLGLVDPFSERFTPDTALLRDRADRSPFRGVFGLMCKHEPDRSFFHGSISFLSHQKYLPLKQSGRKPRTVQRQQYGSDAGQADPRRS